MKVILFWACACYLHFIKKSWDQRAFTRAYSSGVQLSIIWIVVAALPLLLLLGRLLIFSAAYCPLDTSSLDRAFSWIGNYVSSMLVRQLSHYGSRTLNEAPDVEVNKLLKRSQMKDSELHTVDCNITVRFSNNFCI